MNPTFSGQASLHLFPSQASPTTSLLTPHSKWFTSPKNTQMHSPRLLKALLGALALSPLTLAEPNPAKVQDLQPRQTITPGGAACGEHGPENRRCWKNNWTIDK